jgi:predicted ester cyclase
MIPLMAGSVLTLAAPHQDQHATKEAPVADTQNKQIFEQAMAEIFGQGKLEAIGEYVTPDFQEHEEGPGKDRGRDGLTDTVRAVRAAFPDLQVHVEAISEDGDHTWARVRFTGTNTGPLMGHSPTGRAATWTAIDHCRYASGKLTEHWGVADLLSMMQQVGIVPASPGDLAHLRRLVARRRSGPATAGNPPDACQASQTQRGAVIRRLPRAGTAPRSCTTHTGHLPRTAGPLPGVECPARPATDLWYARLPTRRDRTFRYVRCQPWFDFDPDDTERRISRVGH